MLEVLLKNKIVSVGCFESFIMLVWQNKKEDCLNLKTLRLCCPCAFCSGETDVFGKKYIGDKRNLSDDSIKLKGYSFIGLYAIRFIWGDGHSDGLYTFDLLKNISSKFNEN